MSKTDPSSPPCPPPSSPDSANSLQKAIAQALRGESLAAAPLASWWLQAQGERDLTPPTEASALPLQLDLPADPRLDHVVHQQARALQATLRVPAEEREAARAADQPLTKQSPEERAAMSLRRLWRVVQQQQDTGPADRPAPAQMPSHLLPML